MTKADDYKHERLLQNVTSSSKRRTFSLIRSRTKWDESDEDGRSAWGSAVMHRCIRLNLKSIDDDSPRRSAPVPQLIFVIRSIHPFILRHLSFFYPFVLLLSFCAQQGPLSQELSQQRSFNVCQFALEVTSSCLPELTATGGLLVRPVTPSLGSSNHLSDIEKSKETH